MNEVVLITFQTYSYKFSDVNFYKCLSVCNCILYRVGAQENGQRSLFRHKVSK